MNNDIMMMMLRVYWRVTVMHQDDDELERHTVHACVFIVVMMMTVCVTYVHVHVHAAPLLQHSPKHRDDVMNKKNNYNEKKTTNNEVLAMQ